MRRIHLSASLRKLTISIAISMAVFIPIASSSIASADLSAPDCGSSRIANFVQEGVNLAIGQSGCYQGSGDISNGLGILASKVVNVFSIIVGIAAVLMVIYGGFRYIISGGDSSKVGTAKNTLIYAIVGLVIVALAQLIVRYVLSTANGISNDSVGALALLIK